jgi:aminopeptidase N
VAVRAGDAAPVRVLVDGKASVALPGCDAPVVVNAGQKGYYRTRYAPEQFKALAAGFEQLPVVDRLGVMMDAGALAVVGLQPEADLLDLVAHVPLDAADDLWQLAADQLGRIDELYDGDAKQQAAWRRYALSRLSPKFQQLGWDDRESDAAQTRQLRASLLGLLGRLGDRKVIAEANRRFVAFQADPASLPAEQRRTVLGIAARNADGATWDALHALAKKEASPMVRDQYYALLAATDDEALASRALEMALTSEPGATNSAEMISVVSDEHPELAFDFAVAHREQVDGLVDSSSRARYYPGLASGSAKLETASRIEAFAGQHIAPTSRRDAQNAVVAIQTRVKLREQRRPQIDAWLKQQG